MVLAEAGADIVVGLDRGDEVCRYQLRSLVDQLVKGMLAVNAGGTPDDRAGVVVHGFALQGNTLAVALHVALLQVGRQFAQVVVVGQDRVAAGIEKITVPDTQHGQDDRHVLFERGLLEMQVHLVRATEQRTEIVHADHQCDRQADG